jgi:hypothetical protein
MGYYKTIAELQSLSPLQVPNVYSKVHKVQLSGIHTDKFLQSNASWISQIQRPPGEIQLSALVSTNPGVYMMESFKTS